MRVKACTYFAAINIGPAGVWGSGDSADAALKQLCKELKAIAKRFGGLEKDARISVPVYSIREGCYAHKNERGVFEVDRATDEIVAFAEVAYFYTEVDPAKPLTTCRLGKVDDCYGSGGLAQVRQVNADKVAPIGQKVTAENAGRGLFLLAPRF